ncbi:MAG: hypothetical protein V3R16_08910 [Nitrospirales bacterium]
MGKFINFGLAPPQDPMFGIDRSNIADLLNQRNWRKKAICRVIQDRCLYVYVARGRQTHDGKTNERYYALIHFGTEEDRHFRKDFRTLKEVLAYVNGDNGSNFGRLTRPAKPHEFPRGRGPDTYVTGFSSDPGGKLRPNFTVKIPGQFTD